MLLLPALAAATPPGNPVPEERAGAPAAAQETTTEAAAAPPPAVPPPPAPPSTGKPAAPPPSPTPPPAHTYHTTIAADAGKRTVPSERASSLVQRSDLDRRQPRSAPDALRYETGVFVQQTGHGQGSAFIRGLTGQQTLLIFDGIRLNNSTYRQGPNQYFFTLDSRTVESIEVLRGGASTRYGSDALGGVIIAHPVEPGLPSPTLSVTPRLMARAATADQEKGGRVQVDVGAGGRAGLIGGLGGRDVGMLQAAGPVLNPADGQPAMVPRFAPDGRTQLGTGFKEVTGDARLRVLVAPQQTLTVAAYLYRQYDAPRTDLCPPPHALSATCTTYDEQFRHLVYGAWDGRLGRWAKSARVTLSWQQQHERRRHEVPGIRTREIGVDDVNSLGLTAGATTDSWSPRRGVSLALRYGLDTYYDLVSSSASRTYTDVEITRPLDRGQYVEGSRYLYGGVFVDGEIGLGERVTLRPGGRFSWIAASSPAQPASGTLAVSRSWLPVVGHLGLEVRVLPELQALVNVDHSYRAPNLDDLTSRQQTGPGFQFENPNLDAEKATTFEVGVRLRNRMVIADLWLFETLLQDAVVKQPRLSDDCPAGTPQCSNAWTRLQLTNAKGLAEVRGVEAAVRWLFPRGVTARATLSYTWGEAPNTAPDNLLLCPRIVTAERVPLSRIPPLNGTAEIHWLGRAGFGLGGALRWAATQDRLANADCTDARIPIGGTPGFAVVDLRGSYRVNGRLAIHGVLENVFDTPYRYHGSAINGPGRGFILSVEAAPF